MTFKDGATTLGTGTLSNGSATYTTATLTVGAHSLTAVYAGDTGYAASTSSVLTQTINPVVTTATVTSSANPSTYFVIYSINGRATDMNETREWSDSLSETGDYLIRVFMMRSAARRKGAAANFTLSISIH